MIKALRHSLAVAGCAGLLFIGAHGARAQETPTTPSVAPDPPQAQSAPRKRIPSAPPAPRAPKARPSATVVAPTQPQTPYPAPPAQRPAVAPAAPQTPLPPRQVVTVVHRLSGWKLLAWLAVSGPPALEIDRFPSASDVHTNIVAGFVSDDGRSVMARLPQAQAEFEIIAPPALAPSFFPGGDKPRADFPEFMLVNREGKRFKATFVGLDAATGLSLLEAEEPLFPSNGDLGNTETLTASVGQRIHLFAPAPVAPPPAGETGQTEEEETIYLDMGQTVGRLVEVRRAAQGRPAVVTARAPQATSALTGAVATSESGKPLGIVALSGPGETRIVPFEDVRAAAARVRSFRAVVVPRPWLGVRGDAAFKAPLETWVKGGWTAEKALPLIQNRRGVFLTSVAPETPAFQSGLRRGDVIARVGEREVNGIEDLSAVLREAGVGQTVRFTVWRATAAAPFELPVVLSGVANPALATFEAEKFAARSKILEVRSEINATRDEERRLRSEGRAAESKAAALAELEARRRRAERQLSVAETRYNEAEERAAQARFFRLNDWPVAAHGGLLLHRPLRASGVEVIGLTPRSATRLGARGGVLVVSVINGSAAERSGLRAGDIIETIGGKTFSHAELRGLLRNSTGPRLALGVVRGATKLTVSLPLDEREKE